MVRTLEIIEGDEQWDTRYTVVTQDGETLHTESVEVPPSEHIGRVLAEEGVTRIDAEEGYRWFVRWTLTGIVRAKPVPIENKERTPDRSVVV